MAEFRDPIYPGLKSTGKVERGGDKPFHTVINAENYHALQLLSYTHAGKIDAIYIDPPYNTGAQDWKYNNDYVDKDDAYRHSKWLAMMERRLLLARRLLNPENSVLIVTIDEKEYLRLGLLLEQTFPEARIQMVSSAINPAAVARSGAFGRVNEYLYFANFGSAAPEALSLDNNWIPGKGRTHTGTARWDLFRRSGSHASREHSPGCFYPIYIDIHRGVVATVGDPLPAGESTAPIRDDLTAILPIRKNGTEGVWMAGTTEFKRRLSQGRVRLSISEDKVVIYYLANGEYKKVTSGMYPVNGRAPDGSLLIGMTDDNQPRAVPGDQWRIPSHDATQYGSRLISAFVPQRPFPFPKSLYAVEDALRFFVADKPNATILDFFSGSGTTAHAVMRLNKQDGGRRQCISITNNEVSADEQKTLRAKGLRPGDAEWELHGICDFITKPRIRAAITGRTPEGEPIKGDYKFTDEFPMADGFAENAEFFTLSYEARDNVAYHQAFAAVAPLLWLKAGATGRRIETPTDDYALADTYGVLFALGACAAFVAALAKLTSVRMAYIVTNDDRAFQNACAELPEGIEPVRLYESYLSNFTLNRERV